MHALLKLSLAAAVILPLAACDEQSRQATGRGAVSGAAAGAAASIFTGDFGDNVLAGAAAGAAGGYVSDQLRR